MADQFNILDRQRNFTLPTAALAQTMDRDNRMANLSSSLTSGTLRLMQIELPAGLTVSSITAMSGTSGATAPTAQWFGLFDSAFAKLRLTADDGSTAWATNVAKTLNLSSAFTTTYAGRHYVGVCVVAGTPPTLIGLETSTQAAVTAVPILGGNSTSGLTDPASCPSTVATPTACTQLFYAYVS